MKSITSKKPSSILLGALNWLADRNASYRQAIELRGKTDERLADMGITREQANQAFYQRFGNKVADREPMVLTGSPQKAS
jgi:uncharacterized protein YjiS (DUF1127 family)